jgi:flagellar capping protein FliD
VLDSTKAWIKLRNDSLNATLKDLQDQTTQLDARMTKLRAVYTQQYCGHGNHRHPDENHQQLS